MPKRINKNSVALLRDVAECRMLTLSQIAVLHFGSKRSARRRMQQLVKDEFIEVLPVSGGTGFGRPESVFEVSNAGYSLLRSEEVLFDALSFEQVSGSPLLRQAGHQILMNWCRIHLAHLVKEFPQLQIDFLSFNSPFALADGHSGPFVRDFVQFNEDDEPMSFTPDAAVAITDTERGITVPLYLEVDMDTETKAGSQGTDIREKILKYQQYFSSRGYKRYEKVWSAELGGFRLLFVANSQQRMKSLSATVQATPPSDFVWVTSQDKMFTEGISGNIWARGGKAKLGLESILGSLSRPAPLPGLSDK